MPAKISIDTLVLKPAAPANNYEMSMFVPLPTTSGADRVGSNRGAGPARRGNAVVMGRYTPRAGKQAK